MSPDQVLRHALRLMQSEDGRKLLIESLSQGDRFALAYALLSKELLLKILPDVPWTEKESRQLQTLLQASRARHIMNILQVAVDAVGWDGGAYSYTPWRISVEQLTIVQLRDLLRRSRAGDPEISEHDRVVIGREARRRGLE